VRLRETWTRLPRWARWVLAGNVVGVADGTGDHMRWMLHGGIHAYAAAYPQVPIQVLFVGLVVLDPLAAVLAGLARREGVWLSCAIAIMVADVIANWIGNWTRITSPPGRLFDAVPWLITVFGLFVFSTAIPLTRVIRRNRSAGTVSPAQAAS
jgi:hypothetical protein